MFFRLTYPAFLWLAFILIITLIPGKSIPEVKIIGIDKVVHIVIFGILMALAGIGVIRYMRSQQSSGNKLKRGLLIVLIVCFLIGAGIEVLQHYVPGRSFSIADMVANSIGAGVGYGFVLWVYQRYPSNRFIR